MQGIFKRYRFAAGNLTVKRFLSRLKKDAETPYQIKAKTVHKSGVSVEMSYCYSDKATRDAEFEAFDLAKAEKLLASLQSFLTKATA